MENCFFRILLLLLVFTGISFFGVAQNDSLQHHSIHLKPTSDLDQRFYYMQNRWANTWGYRIGVIINDKFKSGIGGYYMSEEIESVPKYISSITRTSGFVEHRQQLYLGTVYYEPFLIRRELWETSLVFETGYGRTVNTYTDDSTEETIAKQNKVFIPVGAGVSFNLKLPPLFAIRPIRWFGINFITGYRKSIYQEDSDFNYDGPFWSLSGAIFLDRIVDDIHKWKAGKRSRSNKVTAPIEF